MATGTSNLDNILSQIRQLDYPDRLNLLEKIVSLIRKENVVKPKAKLTALNGLGSEIWKGEDLDKYINDERQWD